MMVPDPNKGPMTAVKEHTREKGYCRSPKGHVQTARISTPSI